ncbi:MAG: peptide deformylase [Desulfobulbaceae bacterium]|nr:MAG: peptide deformylase [Desulfobulbaceae bacterium]
MSILKIVEYPEPILRIKGEKVETFDEKLRQLIEDMGETMWDAPGIGLAAPQVAQSLQLIVVDVTEPGEEKTFMALVNPVIVAHEGMQVDEEGCLSVPELTAKVDRYKKITVDYQDEQGNPKQLIAEDRFAVVLQHEIDHLNGILFIDHLSPLKRNLYKKKRKRMLLEAGQEN